MSFPRRKSVVSDWAYTPKPSQTVAKIAIGFALFVAVVGIVMNFFRIYGIGGQFVFLVGASAAIFIWMRYFYIEFRFTVSTDGYFEITRVQGKKITVMCSVKTSDIKEIKRISFSEKPKGTLSFLSSMLPKEALLLTIAGDGRNRALLDCDDEIFSVLSSCILNNER